MSDINVPIYVTNQYTQPGYSYMPTETNDKEYTYNDIGYSTYIPIGESKASMGYNTYIPVGESNSSMGYNMFNSDIVSNDEFTSEHVTNFTNGEMITFAISIFLLFTAVSVILSYIM